MHRKFYATLIIAALVGSLSALLTALLFRQWILQDAAIERERFNDHAQVVKEGFRIYREAQDRSHE